MNPLVSFVRLFPASFWGFAFAVLCVAPAQANPVLSITELSSTELTVTVDGLAFGTVSNVGPNHWEWRSGVFGNELRFSVDGGFNLFGAYNSYLGAFWAEPANASAANFVGLAFFDFSGGPDGNGNMGLVIYSEVDPGSTSTNANGSTGMLDFSGGTYSPAKSTLFGPYDVAYFDQGNASRVPDGTPTFALLGLAVGALLTVARVRKIARV